MSGLNNTVEELTQGLTYSTPFTSTASSDPSACPSLSDINNMIYSSIAYGYDVITGCILSLNKSELIDLCSSGNNDREYVSQYANPVSGIPYFFSPVTAGLACRLYTGNYYYLICVIGTLACMAMQIPSISHNGWSLTI